MKIACQRLVNLICRPIQNATILHSTSKTSLCMRPSFKHFCVVSLGHNRMYFSTSKDPQVEEPEANETINPQQSNLTTYIQNSKTIQILQKKGIKSLFPIQIQTFEAVYEGRDLLASDRTGSGKTIAYSLPIIQKLRDKGAFKSGKKQVKFLVMCPTRELTIQVFKEIATLRHSSADFNVVAVYGGSSIDNQIRELRSGVDIIVATPGRLMDLIQRRCINFTELQATCIDEADQMLEKGFKLDIQQIFKIIQNQRKQKTQNLMFSATIPEWVDKISNQYMDKSKKKINLINKQQTQTSMTVEHFAVQCSFYERIKCIQSLIKTYNSHEELSTIIFAETKLEVTDIALEFGKNASFLQGDMDQKEREFNLNMFRNGKRKILIATDIASRGLDIDNVGLVIQLQPPKNTEPFIHRAGRTGRAGKKGICITLFDKKKNLHNMLRIQHEAKIAFKHIARPRLQQSEEMWQKKLNRVPHSLNQFNKSSLINEKIQLMADVLISSNADVKQLIKRQLLAIVGEPPINYSLTTEQTGFKTFTIKMKIPQTPINTMSILSFIKQNFQHLKITNVHVQSTNIIFDVPEASLFQFKSSVNSSILEESPYQVKQMMSLRDLSRGRSSFQNTFSERNDRRMGERSGGKSYREDRYLQSNSQQDKLDLFIPNLPYEVEQHDLQQQLRSMNVQFQSIHLKKKSENHVFAFVSITDPLSTRILLKSGLTINGIRVRAMIAEKRDNIQREGGRNEGFGRPSGQNFDRRVQGRSQGRHQQRDYFERR